MFYVSFMRVFFSNGMIMGSVAFENGKMMVVGSR